jgi:hypothetical protein
MIDNVEPDAIKAPQAILTGGRKSDVFLFPSVFFYVFPAALGVGDKGTSKGGSDHEDAIWLSFVRDWPSMPPMGVLVKQKQVKNVAIKHLSRTRNNLTPQ